LSSLTDVRAITLRVNGGTTALDQRIAETNRAMSLIG
jgi:predicted chitinase